jgi:hypothetical protein
MLKKQKGWLHDKLIPRQKRRDAYIQETRIQTSLQTSETLNLLQRTAKGEGSNEETLCRVKAEM